MPQSLIQLPQTAYFKIEGWPVTIREHEIVGDNSLVLTMTLVIKLEDYYRGVLSKFEKEGISFEAAIEECARELEQDTNTFTEVIYWFYGFCEFEEKDPENIKGFIHSFSESEAGRTIAGQIVEKIRSCNSWEELYDELQWTSKFHKNILCRIKKGLEDNDVE